jgi:uncharacterized protein (TIGR03435 family)
MFCYLALASTYGHGLRAQESRPRAQETPPSSVTPIPFDIVSVKTSNPDNLGFGMKPDPNNFRMSGASLKFLVQYAYDIHDFQVQGGPNWINSARYDIAAKMDQPTESEVGNPSTVHQGPEARQKLVELRLQALLADRFGLRIHRESKEMPVYAMVVGKGGSKLMPPKVNTGYTTARGLLKCGDFSMSDLALSLSEFVSRMVIDKTGLTGRYSFTLKWTPEDYQDADQVLPGLFTALQEQLGLRLETQKAQVPIVVIDKIVRPSEN